MAELSNLYIGIRDAISKTIWKYTTNKNWNMNDYNCNRLKTFPSLHLNFLKSNLGFVRSRIALAGHWKYENVSIPVGIDKV